MTFHLLVYRKRFVGNRAGQQNFEHIDHHYIDAPGITEAEEQAMAFAGRDHNGWSMYRYS